MNRGWAARLRNSEWGQDTQQLQYWFDQGKDGRNKTSHSGQGRTNIHRLTNSNTVGSCLLSTNRITWMCISRTGWVCSTEESFTSWVIRWARWEHGLSRDLAGNVDERWGFHSMTWVMIVTTMERHIRAVPIVVRIKQREKTIASGRLVWSNKAIRLSKRTHGKTTSRRAAWCLPIVQRTWVWRTPRRRKKASLNDYPSSINDNAQRLEGPFAFARQCALWVDVETQLS